MTIDDKKVIISKSEGTPRGWGNDELSKFLENAHTNEITCFARKSAYFKKLKEIDRTFVHATECVHCINEDTMVIAAMLLKTHSAYRAGVRLAMSGQVVEAFMVLRGCLETALYAYYMNGDLELIKLWLSREDNDETRKRVRQNFQLRVIIQKFEDDYPKRRLIAQKLYDRAIDYGAHPNERGFLSTIETGDKDNAIWNNWFAVGDDNVFHDFALLFTCQIGVIALIVFQVIFKLRFEIYGLSSNLARLEQDLLTRV